MKAILTVKDLNKSFGAVVAASNINVQLYKGEVVAVIGSNGAGKTTFVNMVTGYLKPTSGSIKFMDHDITGKSPKLICKTGLSRSFQVAQLFPSLTALENMLVAFSSLRMSILSFFRPLSNYSSKEKSLNVLEHFNISSSASEIVRTLPQGVRKLLDISMAMISNPKLLLLDEPTSGVAVEEKFPLMETVMNGIRKTDSTVLFIEHDMEIVSRYATRVIAFYEGEVIADGPTDEVLKDERVRKYIVGEIQDKSEEVKE